MTPQDAYINYILYSYLISAILIFCYLSYVKEGLLTTILISLLFSVFGIIGLPFVLLYWAFAVPYKLIGYIGEKYGKN